jgi:hypothetical protein
MSAIDEASEESHENSYEAERNPFDERRRSDATSLPPFRHSSEIFELFIELLGPSMKSLAYTLSEVLRDPPFGSAPDYEITVNEHFRHSLTDALSLFNEARAHALQELYKTLELDRTRSQSIQADFEEVAAACGHFSFSLQTFGEEMQKYLDVLDDLKFASEHRRRSWHWLEWWKNRRQRGWKAMALPYDNQEQDALIKPIKKAAMPRGIADPLIRRRDTYNWEAASETKKRTIVATASQRLLGVVRKAARDDGETPQSTLRQAFIMLTPNSSTWLESRCWGSPLGIARLHAANPGAVPTLARRMGPPLVHDCLFHDSWLSQHHGLGQIPGNDAGHRHSRRKLGDLTE